MSIQSGPKVQVVTAYGVGGLGVMDPKLDMVTDKGTITSINLPFVNVSGANTYQTSVYYPEQLQVLQSEASGNWSWPSGDGSLVFGHSDTFPDGPPLRMSRPSAVVTTGTNNLQIFTRE